MKSKSETESKKTSSEKEAETKITIGDTIEFNYSRIMKGNPVSGIVTDLDDEWIVLKLFKYIEGIRSTWEKGEEKLFRKSLIYGSIKKL